MVERPTVFVIDKLRGSPAMKYLTHLARRYLVAVQSSKAGRSQADLCHNNCFAKAPIAGLWLQQFLRRAWDWSGPQSQSPESANGAERYR